MAVLYKTVQSILANKAGVKVFYPRVTRLHRPDRP